jgi:hypothetical protein
MIKNIKIIIFGKIIKIDNNIINIIKYILN